jgi:predicted nicotinamide N-methyase
MAAEGAEVWMADPGRAYLPAEGLQEVARYRVPTSMELEDRTHRETVLFRFDAGLG